MKVILTEAVAALGDIGSIVNVKDGYARNYLLPRSIAVVANEGNQKQLEHHKRILTARRAKALATFRSLAGKIEKLTLEVSKQVGDEERIFGSVTAAELAELAERAGVSFSRKLLKVPDEARSVGLYKAQVRLHAEVVAELKFRIVAANQPAEA